MSGSVIPVPRAGVSAPALTPRRFVPRPVVGLLAVIVAALIVYGAWVVWGTAEHDPLRDAWLYCAIGALAAGAVGVRAVLVATDRTAMLLLSTGLFLWVGGDVYYTAVVVPIDPQPPVTIADVFYLALYPFLIASLIMMLRSRVSRPPASLWLDALLSALTVAAIAFIWVTGLLVGGDDDPAAAIVNGAYPALDLLTACMIAAILTLLNWRLERMWIMFLIAAGCLAAFDVAYFAGVLEGEMRPGLLLDFGWLLALVLLAFAAWAPPAVVSPPSIGWRGVAVPMVVISLATAVIVFGDFVQVPVSSTVLATTALIVGGGRVAVAFIAVSGDAALRRQQREDSITGLGTRRLVYLRLDDAIAELAPHRECIVLVFDLNGFREVNRSLGHAAGDELLRQVGARIAHGLGREAVVGRVAADEFVAVLTDVASRATVVARANRVIDAVSVPFRIAQTEIEIGACVGLAVCPQHAFTREGVLKAANAALARAKKTRQPVVVFNPDLDELESGTLSLSQDLRRGIRAGEIVCYFQPKLDLTDGLVHCVEVLTRWRHPREGMIFPDVFIPLAERGGFMGAFTRAVLREALSQCRRWRAAGLDVQVAVNLSVTNLVDGDMPGDIGRMLSETEVPANRLILEVTETVLTADETKARQVRGDLQAIGVEISVDDYGKGYSSLRQVRSLHASEVKLDAEFVTGVAENVEQAAIVSSTVKLAHELGLRLVAEGVETRADLAAVARLGCDEAQGYYIRRPAPEEEITKWLWQREGKPWQGLAKHRRSASEQVTAAG